MTAFGPTETLRISFSTCATSRLIWLQIAHLLGATDGFMRVKKTFEIRARVLMFGRMVAIEHPMVYGYV